MILKGMEFQGWVVFYDVSDQCSMANWPAHTPSERAQLVVVCSFKHFTTNSRDTECLPHIHVYTHSLFLRLSTTPWPSPALPPSTRTHTHKHTYAHKHTYTPTHPHTHTKEKKRKEREKEKKKREKREGGEEGKKEVFFWVNYMIYADLHLISGRRVQYQTQYNIPDCLVTIKPPTDNILLGGFSLAAGIRKTRFLLNRKWN